MAFDKKVDMFSAALKPLAGILLICAIFSSAFAYATCSVDEVTVSGRVEDAPPKGTIRVQLIYANQKLGESGEATLEGGFFRIEIPFLTQSRAPVLIGSLREKCDRKPKTIVVTLNESDEEYDRVSLEFPKDFRMDDPSAYSLRSKIVLHGHPSPSAPQ